MILCGERVNAEQAQRIGLVEEVVENGNAREAALALAARVAAQSPIAVTACKKLIQHTRVGTHNGFVFLSNSARVFRRQLRAGCSFVRSAVFGIKQERKKLSLQFRSLRDYGNAFKQRFR